MSSGYFCLSKFKTSLARIGNNSHSPISLLIKIQCQTHDWALYLCPSHSYQNYLSLRLWGPISFRFWKISIRTIWYSQRMAETQDQQFRPKTEFLLTCSLARIGSISYSRLSVTVFLFLFIYIVFPIQDLFLNNIVKLVWYCGSSVAKGRKLQEISPTWISSFVIMCICFVWSH